MGLGAHPRKGFLGRPMVAGRLIPWTVIRNPAAEASELSIASPNVPSR